MNKPPNFWDLYKWQVIGAIAVCAAEALLIAGLLLERANRRRAEEGLREGQLELRRLTGRLLLAQETERRRIALELHDDLNQSLALLAVDLDLLGQNPPVSGALLGERMHELSGRVKQLSSEVHELSHQLHPTKVEQLGLVVAVRGLCGELSHAHGVDIDFTAEQVASTISADTSCVSTASPRKPCGTSSSTVAPGTSGSNCVEDQMRSPSGFPTTARFRHRLG